jgi:potassium-transporting ATPase ATP-binding subunit
MTHKAPSLFDWNIVGPAMGNAFKKLDPRLMIKNPVMFVTMVGAALTTVGIFTGAPKRSAASSPTRPLALVHRAVRQFRRSRGRRPRQSPGRQPCANPQVKPSPAALRNNGQRRRSQRHDCARATCRAVRAGDIIPADGDVIEGIASVDESAITGESAPVIRESGGDRSAVTGGTRVLSDEIKIRVTINPGNTFLDRMIALVEGARRQKTPNEIALTILLSALTLIFLLVCVTLKPFGIYSGRRIFPCPCWSRCWSV